MIHHKHRTGSKIFLSYSNYFLDDFLVPKVLPDPLFGQPNASFSCSPFSQACQIKPDYYY
jgi:hypothetical protein